MEVQLTKNRGKLINKMNRGIDAMRRHLAKPGILKLKNEDGTEDEIEMKPLGTRYFPEFWGIFEGFASIDPKALSGENDMDFKKIFEALDKHRIKVVGELITKSMKSTYPDAKNEVVDAFISKNFFELMMLLIEVNLPAVDEQELEKITKKNKK